MSPGRFMWTGEDAAGADVAIPVPSRCDPRGLPVHVAYVRQGSAGAFWSVLGSPECGPMDYDVARVEASAALVELGFEPPERVLVWRDRWVVEDLVPPVRRLAAAGGAR